MSSLNLSTNGPSINKSYQSVLNAPAPAGGPAASPTYGQWAVFTVAAPLVSAFQQDGGKESVMKVQTTGEGELLDFIEEFSDGRIQFGFVKVKDPNTTLPKCVLVGWCGEGVPERTKGYFTSHLATVSRLLQGYHVQITARSDRDLTPEGIIQKVADASGSKYSGAVAAARDAPPAPMSSKPVFLPTRVASGSSGFNPLGSRPRPAGTGGVDEDGWGADAPQVTRSQLEKVPSAYQPTRVNMAELTAQKQPISQFTPQRVDNDSGDIVRGGYQPIGKVNIAEIRSKAKESGEARDDRPTVVKGSYEPVGKVDIAAIRARAQPTPSGGGFQEPRDEENEPTRPLPDRSAVSQSSERITTLPKPRVASKFGGSSSFVGTRAPVPSGFAPISNPSSAPVGAASRTFADEGGKTPAQIWAEKKARQGGSYVSPSSTGAGVTPPVQSQTSGDGGWRSGYAGKSWAPVQTTKTGQSASSNPNESNVVDQTTNEGPNESVGSIRERFSAAPPPMDVGSKPNTSSRAVPPPPEEEEDVRPSSPIRVAMPVGRSAHDDVEEPRPAARAVPAEPTPKAAATSGPAKGGKRAVVQYDYEKAEDNEIELKEGDYVTNIEMVDDDWWMGQNVIGETGLFPANYVELVEDEEEAPHAPAAAHSAPHAEPQASHAEPPASHGDAKKGKTATAQYDYEAAEDNELSFPDGATITNVEFPDDDWWFGEFNGKSGLFPANYVQIDS